jgi:enamine deaminase RidA (YjgF/YER057c/UK114 family)
MAGLVGVAHWCFDNPHMQVVQVAALASPKLKLEIEAVAAL